ncbi:MAG: hypothetical protein NT092_13675 [Bacteroidia bacterium]|nr:hypothetical protein [Bacteroidia bacterium]
MKRIILISLLAFCTLALPAQEKIPQPAERPMNDIVINLLGDGSNVSVNYERLVRFSDFIFLSGSLGAGYGKKLTLSDTIVQPAYLTIPAMISFNAGKGRHFAEAGIGCTAAIGNVDPHLLYYLSGGYRFQPMKSGNLSLRIYGNWLFNSSSALRNIYFIPFGASLGMAF